MKDAQKLAKVEPPGKWKWAASPGDGRRFSVFACNAHIKCPLVMSVAAVGDSYYLQFKGEHAVEENTRARKNSAMTFAEEATLKQGANMGAKPAQVLVSLTVDKKEQLQREGKDPLQHKRKEGGLEGARESRITSVLGMYQDVSGHAC